MPLSDLAEERWAAAGMATGAAAAFFGWRLGGPNGEAVLYVGVTLFGLSLIWMIVALLGVHLPWGERQLYRCRIHGKFIRGPGGTVLLRAPDEWGKGYQRFIEVAQPDGRIRVFKADAVEYEDMQEGEYWHLSLKGKEIIGHRAVSQAALERQESLKQERLRRKEDEKGLQKLRHNSDFGRIDPHALKKEGNYFNVFLGSLAATGLGLILILFELRGGRPDAEPVFQLGVMIFFGIGGMIQSIREWLRSGKPDGG